jgi:chromosome partitioning protein
MNVLVVASAKGGVGKTTVALHVAHSMAKLGLRVLLVDTDPQGAIGLSLSRRLSHQVGFAEFIAQTHALRSLVVRTRVPNFSILPVGQISPTEVDPLTRAVSDGTRFQRLASEAQIDHDILVIDTPAGLGGITAGAMRGGGRVLSPIQAEPIALRSVTHVIEMVSALKEEGANLDLVGFLLTMLQMQDANSMAVAQEVWGMFPKRLLFETNVPRDPVFLEATAAGVPVPLLRTPPPPVSHVFDVITGELIDRIYPKGEGRGPQPFLD